MNDEIIDKLAEQAQKYADDWGKGEIGWNDLFNSKFAELVAAHEREECAKIAESELNNCIILTSYPAQSSAAYNIANKIRARGET